MEITGDYWRLLEITGRLDAKTGTGYYEEVLTNVSRNSCCEREEFRLCMLQGPARLGRLWGMCLCGEEKGREERGEERKEKEIGEQIEEMEEREEERGGERGREGRRECK